MKAHHRITGEGPTVVLLHGSMASQEQWRPLVQELQVEYRVITMDLLGYGKTPFPENPATYGLDDESAVLQHIIETTLPKDEPYHLIGHSYGGAVAMYHGYIHKSRVCSLTAIEPMAFHLLEKSHQHLRISQQMIEEIRGDISRGDAIEGAEKFIDLWMSTGTFDRLGEREKTVLGKGVKKMVLDFQAAAAEPLSITDYATLPRPFNLIAGRKSPPYSLSITELIAREIEGNGLFWVDGGHFSPVSHYYQVNPLIKQLLADAEKLKNEGVHF